MPSDSPRSKPKGFPSTSRPSTSTYICLIACNQQLQHRSTPTPCSSPLSRQVQYRSTLTSCSHASSTLSRQFQYRSTPNILYICFITPKQTVTIQVRPKSLQASSPLSKQLQYRQLQQHVHHLEQIVTIQVNPNSMYIYLTAYSRQSQYHIYLTAHSEQSQYHI